MIDRPAPGDAADTERELDLAPYRILQRIGSGGMGEVFLAEDDRLARRVAIKRLRTDLDPDLGNGAAFRERLRREARYAAGLSHPAIVQVHDVLERDGADYVVMEWVDGEDLRRRLRRDGPLSVEQAVHLGRHLAEGLAEAHRHGIVHRDFKSENVIVDAQGRAKITDFGIAKRLPGGEEELTEADSVLGTHRVMSPEQVLGEPLDPRSDLFSFGVLLYEALSGASPFERPGPVATMRAIVEDEPAPIETLRPGLPPELVELVHHLLRKEPELRPRSAREVAMALAELDQGEETAVSPSLAERPPAVSPEKPPAAPRTSRLAGLLLLAILAAAFVLALVLRRPQAAPPAEAPVYVAALAPTLTADAAATPVAEAETFAAAVRVAVVRGLIGLEGVSAKATAEIDRATGSPFDIARSLAAEELVTASIHARSKVARLSLERLRVADGVILWSDTFELPTDDLVLVMQAVGAKIAQAYGEHAMRPGFQAVEVETPDLQRYLHLRRRFLDRADPTGETLVRELESLRLSSPAFVESEILLGRVSLHRFYDSRDPSHLERAERAVRDAERLAPADPRVRRLRVDIELRAGRLDSARAALEKLGETIPGDLAISELEARLLRAEGRPRQALASMRRAVALAPSLQPLINLARLEIDLGEIDSARAHLRQAMQLSADDFELLSLLAQLELTAGDPTEAVELYGRLLERSAGTSELSNLGLAHMLLGAYDRAADYFERALATEPRNPFFALNLADALGLAGEEGRAQQLYGEVVERVRADPFAERAQFLSVEAQALAHLGEHRPAVGVIQRALAKAPESASVAYEAALVYAVVGEQTSALVQAEAALRRGMEPRWFALPFFDGLRRQPDFAALLEAARAGELADPE